MGQDHRKTVLRALVLATLASTSAGCLVTQPQRTPVPAMHLAEPETGAQYWIYVPSYYKPDRDWPLVVTLHGSGFWWDSSKSQIREWKHLAERRGLIVAAPKLASAPSWIVSRDGWYKDLRQDEGNVLAILKAIAGKYRIDPGSVLLSGYLEGGYAMYYIGLRNPRRFNAMIARDCYSDREMLERIKLTAAARQMPMVIMTGKDGGWTIPKQSWQAYAYLRKNQCFEAKRKEVRGGHYRRPERAYGYWSRYLPPRHHRQ